MKTFNITELQLSDIFKIKCNKCSDVSKLRDIIKKKKIQSVIKFKISILVWHKVVQKKIPWENSSIFARLVARVFQMGNDAAPHGNIMLSIYFIKGVHMITLEKIY